jgi:hypothetical protein
MVSCLVRPYFDQRLLAFIERGSLKHDGPPEAKRPSASPYSLVTLGINVAGAVTVSASATVMAENVARKKLPSEEELNNFAKWHSCCPLS